jgi:hypothetical protein
MYKNAGEHLRQILNCSSCTIIFALDWKGRKGIRRKEEMKIEGC